MKPSTVDKVARIVSVLPYSEAEVPTEYGTFRLVVYREDNSDIEALNAATSNIPAERLRMHICWGNYEGPHDHDIALEKVMGIILKSRAPRIRDIEAAFEDLHPY